jgi:hypothetical protein
MLVLIVMLGLGGFVYRHIEKLLQAAPVDARGDFWAAEDLEGRRMTVERFSGLGLQRGEKLRLNEETDDYRYQSLSLDWARQDASAILQIVFRETPDGAFGLKLAPKEKGGIVLGYRNKDGKYTVLGSAKDKDWIGSSLRRIRVTVNFATNHIATKINGEEVLKLEKVRWSGGDIYITAPQALCIIHRLGVTGMSRNADGAVETFGHRELFTSLEPVVPWSEIRRFLVETVAVLLLIYFYFPALCLGNPSLSQRFRACLLFLFPPACYHAVGLVAVIPEFPLFLCFFILLGLILALFVLREPMRKEAPMSGPGKIRAAIIGLLVLVPLAWFFGSYHASFHEQSLNAEHRAQRRPEPPPFAEKKVQYLSPNNSMTVDGKYRNAEITAKIRIAGGSIFQIRTRAASPKHVQGVSLFLSTDHRFDTGFYLETFSDFKPIGEGSLPLTHTDYFDVSLRMEGRSFEALVNGEKVASAETRIHPEGSIVLLPATGHATIQDLQVMPLPMEEDPASSVQDIIRGAAPPVVLLLLYAALAAWLLRIPYLRILEVGSLSLAPLIFCISRLTPTGPLDTALLLAFAFLVCFLLLLHPLLHAAGRFNLLRYAVIVLAILSSGIAIIQYGRERAWPVDYDVLSRLSLAHWSVDHLEKDLVHLQIPALRRWNHYLAQHEFRERKHELRKRPGVTRIVALGTSSTYGYRVREPYSLCLERFLNQAGYNVEMIIGAYQGTSGTRLLQFFRNVLLEFSPDIVTLSLFYNDSYALTQMDEAAYLDRACHFYYRRSLIDDVRDRISMWIGTNRMKNLMRDYTLAQGSLDLEKGPDSPPARYEAMLRTYANLAIEHGFELVLIKEPIAGGKDRLWKKEFYDAMDRVGAEFKLTVIDPTPALNAMGGERLFRDHVHPFDEGDTLIAKMMLPIFKKLLDRRAEKKGRPTDN